ASQRGHKTAIENESSVLCGVFLWLQRSIVLVCFFFFKQKTAYEIGLGIPAEPLFRSKWLETNNLFNNLIQRNQSAAFSSGKVRPNHETNINIIARRTGKDVNSHTVLDGIITTIMATIQRINIIGSREGSRNRR